jgi:hypothetical protein
LLERSWAEQQELSRINHKILMRRANVSIATPAKPIYATLRCNGREFVDTPAENSTTIPVYKRRSETRIWKSPSDLTRPLSSAIVYDEILCTGATGIQDKDSVE